MRKIVDSAFSAWAIAATTHPWTVIAIVLTGCLALGSQLPRLEIDADDDAFLHEDDPVRVTYDAYRALFGRDHVAAIAIEGPEIFDVAFLERLRALHRDLEREVPQLGEVTSLLNARRTYGRVRDGGLDEELVVEDLLEDWPRDASDVALVKERVFANPLYRNYLISADGRTTMLYAEFDTWSSLVSDAEALAQFEAPAVDGDAPAQAEFLTGEESFAIWAQIEPILERHQRDDFRLYATGGPVVNAVLMIAMQEDIVLMVMLSVAMMAAMLMILFRHWVGVALPLVVVILALLCTVASMAALGVAITLPIQVLPTLLLAVGVGDSVHILAIFFRQLAAGRPRREAIVLAVEHSGLPVLMTSLTTAGGLASFAVADLAPVMHFGIFGPMGVGFAFVFSVILLPALLAVVPLGSQLERPNSSSRAANLAAFAGQLGRLGAAAVRHPLPVLGVTAAALVVAGLGAARLEFSHHPVEWLPIDGDLRVASRLVDDRLQGSSGFELQIETGRENGLHDPDLLRRLDGLRSELETLDHDHVRVGKVVSVVDILKEIHQALNSNRPESYAVPETRELVAQEFLLFENAGSDDLEDFVDSTFSTAGFMFRIPETDAIHLAPFVDEIEARFGRALGDEIEVTVTGSGVLASRTFAAVIRSMARSYATALVIIVPLMILFLGDVRIGLISLIPNVTPIVLTLGLMGWLGFRLDFSTMMIGAIVLGVAVDDTIHFMHGVRRGRLAGRSTPDAVRETLESTGLALTFTSIVLCLGFLIYLTATMGNLFNIGLFTAFAIVAAYVADIIVTPALLSVADRLTTTRRALLIHR